MRVRGIVSSRYGEQSSASTRNALLLRVDAVEPLLEPLPVLAPTTSAIAADRPRWDRRLVIYEGTWHTGFETSSLDHDIWLEPRPSSIEGAYARGRLKAGDYENYRVRVTGRLYAHGAIRYGHLGQYAMALDATRVEILEHLDGGKAP